MYWWMVTQAGSEHSPEYYKKWAPDLNRDPVHRWIERFHINPVAPKRRGISAAGLPARVKKSETPVGQLQPDLLKLDEQFVVLVRLRFRFPRLALLGFEGGEDIGDIAPQLLQAVAMD